ncbi:MAG: PAS domain-containing protein [Chromatocurvus sp.]
MGERLVQHPGVRSALMDGLSRTEEPPRDDTMDDAALIVIERLSLHPDEPATVFDFATRHAADIDRALALMHALASETATQLMLLRQSPLLAKALAEVECGVTVADATLEEPPLVYVNDAFTRMTGYTCAKSLGRNCRFLQGDLRDQPGAATAKNAMTHGLDCSTVVTNFRKNGELQQMDPAWQQLPAGLLAEISGINPWTRHFTGEINSTVHSSVQRLNLGNNTEQATTNAPPVIQTYCNNFAH